MEFLLTILDKYGIGVAQFALLAFLGWKICFNHLAHIQNAIEGILEVQKKHDEKLDTVISEVAYLKGKIEG